MVYDQFGKMSICEDSIELPVWKIPPTKTNTEVAGEKVLKEKSVTPAKVHRIVPKSAAAVVTVVKR